MWEHDFISRRKPSIDIELFDLWEDNVAIISPDGTIIYTNKSWKSFARYNGLDPAECSEGTNYLKICDEATGEHSNEASIAAEGIRDVISGNKNTFNLEYPCHSPDEKHWFLLKVTPILRTYPTDVFLQHINITDRKESENKFKNYINNAPDGIFVTDKNGYYVDVNNAACEITGYSMDEFIGMHLLELLPDEVHKYVIDKFEYARNKGKTDIEIPYLTKDGDKRWWRVTAAYLSEDRIIGFVKDITKQKNTESALSEVLAYSQIREKEIAELLSSITAILGIDDFEAVARHIFDACAQFIGAKAGYVALLSDSGEEKVLFLEGSGMPCSVDPNLPMPVRGLRARAYETGQVFFENDFMASEWVKYMPEGHMR
jgi:PAS domain S-box-containing protein